MTKNKSANKLQFYLTSESSIHVYTLMIEPNKKLKLPHQLGTSIIFRKNQ